MLFKKDTILYAMPIRFWEEKTPIRCIIQQDTKTSDVNLNIPSTEAILVYSGLYGHDVYVNRKHLFLSEENCKKAIDLYSNLHDLYFHDEVDVEIDEIMAMIIKGDPNK